MTIDDMQTLYQQQKVHEALVVFESLNGGWVVEFRTEYGDLPLTDGKGCRVSFDHELDAEEAISRIGECAVQIFAIHRAF